jgi:hypothetical protein
MADRTPVRPEPRHARPGRRRVDPVLAVIVVTLLLFTAGVIRYLSRDAEPAATTGNGSPTITVVGDQILRGGQPWWFLGYNSFTWSSDCGDADERMSIQDVDAWLASMRHDGHGAVRLFFFPGWNIDRLDAALASARKYNVYLTITLDNGIEGCGRSAKDADWFKDPEQVAVYQQHMTMLLERYRGESMIAWFEYFNEPSWAGGELRRFYDEMGAVADSVDPGRLFSTGTIAPYALDGDANYLDLNESPGVDIASLHEYDADTVESHHGQDALANSAGKPVIVGEFGIYASTTGQGRTGDGDDCQADLTGRARLMAEKAEAYTSIEGYAGALAWAWQPGDPIDTCSSGNLAEDQHVQDILRDAVRS